MKRCLNPNCESAFLFGDDKTVCPFCHGPLAENGSGTGMAGDEEPRIIPADRIRLRDVQENASEFIRERMGCMECHGRITEIDHQELFFSGGHKMFRTLLRGEPYQFSHQTVEYAIRVENLTNGFPTEVTDFCLYGSYMGRLQIGDEVIVKAKNRGSRRVVKSIYNTTTGSFVRPGLQIPAWLVRGILGFLVIALILFVSDVVQMVQTGAVMNGLMTLILAFLPEIIILFGIWYAVKSAFFRKNRR
ncbi:MAG: hypothetical protein Q4C61_06555 [Lachnospiraceae bacterium]|nr:hypothetical protein [Lachnospiraceae bacterium]